MYNMRVPWLPGEQRTIWSIEAKIEFDSQDAPVKASLPPDNQPGFERLSERTASPGFGLAFVDEGGARRAEWSIRQASGQQTLYYQRHGGRLNPRWQPSAATGAAPGLTPARKRRRRLKNYWTAPLALRRCLYPRARTHQRI